MLPGVLILLLLVLSFNAYACLFPLFPLSSSGMEGCPESSEQTARSGCDAFTTLGPLSGKPATVDVQAQALIVSHGTMETAMPMPFDAGLGRCDQMARLTPPRASASPVLRL